MGGNVRPDIWSPLSIHFLALKSIFTYLLTNFVAVAEVGHKIVETLSETFRELYPGIIADSFPSKHLVLFEKVAHPNRKWVSLSTQLSEQYLQSLSFIGKGLGFAHLPVSIPR